VVDTNKVLRYCFQELLPKPRKTGGEVLKKRNTTQNCIHCDWSNYGNTGKCIISPSLPAVSWESYDSTETLLTDVAGVEQNTNFPFPLWNY
jgi:hypothetical protein